MHFCAIEISIYVALTQCSSLFLFPYFLSIWLLVNIRILGKKKKRNLLSESSSYFASFFCFLLFTPDHFLLESVMWALQRLIP